VFSWFDVLKFLAPVAIVAALYFYAHDAGWKERDATVAAEKQKAVDDQVAIERTACDGEKKALGGIAYDLQKKNDSAYGMYADVVGKLYDRTHAPDGSAGDSRAASGGDGTSGIGRLYYADPAGARPAIDRSLIATKQANRLIGCQAYVREVCLKAR
jgi:hypothetical protein